MNYYLLDVTLGGIHAALELGNPLNLVKSVQQHLAKHARSRLQDPVRQSKDSLCLPVLWHSDERHREISLPDHLPANRCEPPECHCNTSQWPSFLPPTFFIRFAILNRLTACSAPRTESPIAFAT